MAKAPKATAKVPKDDAQLKKERKGSAATAAAPESKSAKPVSQTKKSDKKGKKSAADTSAAADKSLDTVFDPAADPVAGSSDEEATGTQQVAPTAIIDGQTNEKHSPKHKDAKKQPEKSALKPVKSSSKKRKAVQEPETAENADEQAESSEAAAAEDGDDLDFLAGFEDGSEDEDDGDEADSSDDENVQPILAKELPQPKSAAKGKQAAAKGKAKKDAPGVVYLGRVPHGFHEEEMRSYFEQFGEVTRLRLSRNKKTGASKHYAFIEFQHSAVAEIVAETMGNYLLHGHIMQCKVVPSEQVHPKLWIGANRKFRPVPQGRMERLRHNAPKTDEQKDSIAKRLVKREDAKRSKLKDLGIDYDFDGYKSTSKKAIKDTKSSDKAVESTPAELPAKASKKAAASTTKAATNGKTAPARSAKKPRKST